MAKKLPYRGSEPTKYKKIKLKKDDEVIIISGSRDDKGKKGKILSIDKKNDRVYVSGINKKKKYFYQIPTPNITPTTIHVITPKPKSP
jgi:large subunit ribosomal protein L24